MRLEGLDQISGGWFKGPELAGSIRAGTRYGAERQCQQLNQCLSG